MAIRHLTLHQLRIFDVVARHLSFARAAEELHLTPPAVSIQVKQLMEATGRPLFEQIGKKIFLTAAGQTLWAASRDVLGRLEQASQEIAALEGIEKGVLKLGIITTAQYFIPRLLGAFCVEHPSVDAALFVGNREALLERLTQNQDDLYILGQPPGHMNVVAQTFAENPLVVVARPDHILANASHIAPSALGAFPFILRERGSGTRLTTEKFFAEEAVTIQKRMELGSNEAVKQAVAGGLGIAVLSAITLRAEITSGDLATLDVKGFPLERQWYVVHAQGKHLAPVARAFRDSLLCHRP